MTAGETSAIRLRSTQCSAATPAMAAQATSVTREGLLVMGQSGRLLRRHAACGASPVGGLNVGAPSTLRGTCAVGPAGGVAFPAHSPGSLVGLPEES